MIYFGNHIQNRGFSILCSYFLTDKFFSTHTKQLRAINIIFHRILSCYPNLLLFLKNNIVYFSKYEIFNEYFCLKTLHVYLLSKISTFDPLFTHLFWGLYKYTSSKNDIY